MPLFVTNFVSPGVGASGFTNTDVIVADSNGALNQVASLTYASPNLTLPDGSTIKPSANTTGLDIGSATTDKLGFFGATPVVQQTGSSDVLASLVTLGFRAASSNPPLNLGTGAITTGGMTLANTGTITFTSSGVVLTNGGASGVSIASPISGFGLQIGTASTDLVGFYGHTPVAQQAGSTDILAGLVNQGFRGASSNPPLNLGTGTLTAGTTSVGALTSTSIAATGTVALTNTMTVTDAINIAVGTTTGTKIGTATTQKLGFFNATPVVQESGSNDVLASLVTLGLRAASSNPPLNLGTGSITAGTIVGSALRVGSNSASAGIIQIPNTSSIRWRNAANSADLTGISFNASNQLQLGDSTGAGILLVDGINVVLQTTTGTQFGTATTQKLAFFGSTPVVQEAGTNDVLASLVTLGLRAASSNPPLNLGTGTLTAGTTSVGALTSTSIAGTGTVALTNTMTVTDAINIAVGTSTGTKIGTATTQKIGFYNTTPVVQASTFSAVVGTGSTNVTPFGYTTAAQADAVVANVNSIRTALRNIGIVA